MEIEIHADDFVPYTHTDLNKEYGHHARYIITGDLPEGVSLNVDGQLILKGQLSHHTTLTATGKVILKANAGNHLTVSGKDIEAENVTIGVHSTLEAFGGSLKLHDVGRDAQLRADRDIEFFSTGRDLKAEAGGDIYFNEIGDKSHVIAASVSGGSVGKDGDITATKKHVRLSYAGHRSRIFSTEPAQIVSQGNGVTLNDYSEERPITAIDTTTIARDPVAIRHIIYDEEEKRFLIPRDLPEHIDAASFIDAAQDMGCTIKNAPASDTICAAYITLPAHMRQNGLSMLSDLATKVNNPELLPAGRGR